MSRDMLIVSADPAITEMAQRRAEKAAEATRLYSLLVAYTSRVQPAEDRPMISPLAHYSMLDAPECGCPTCIDWEQRRSEFVDAAALVPKGHKWSICSCADCRFVGRVQLNYLASNNRRDLLIEMSFHAQHHSRHGARVMEWLEMELRSPNYTVNWCAQEMSRYPVERWIRRCEMALSGALSGAVFVSSAGVTQYEVHTGSSLGGTTSFDGAGRI